MGEQSLDQLLRRLVGAGGSDLHVKAGVRPRLRVDGTLVAPDDLPVLRPEDTEAMAASIMPAHLAELFASVHHADFAYVLDGRERFRVNAYRQRHTVALVFRRVGTRLGTIADLHLPPVVQRLADEPRGLVLVSGPTGSGKSTTLAAMIEHINVSRPVNIITLEDPVEFIHDDNVASVSQREMGVDFVDFTSGLRAALRGTVCQRLVVRADGRGRVPVVETMVVNGRIQQCLLDVGQLDRIAEIIAEGEYYGMQTFDQHLAQLIEAHVIDLPAALAAATNPHDLRVRLLRSGTLSA